MTLPGPSSHHRIAACVTSEALPHARSTSEASARGDAVHDFLASCVTLGKERALEAVPPEHQETVERIPLDRLPPLDPTHYAAEVSFGFNLATGECRELGRGLTREEAHARAKSGEMVGTADLVGLVGDAVLVFDWKSGRGHVDRADVNWQVRDYCLMAARCYGRERAVGSIVRVLDDGVWYDSTELDALELGAHEAELRSLMDERARVIALPPAERPQLHEGVWCRYCPALPFCPAKQQLVATLAAAPGQLEAQTLELTPERAGKAWERIQAAEQLLERLRAVLKDYARTQPFSVGDGSVVEEVTEHRETLVAARAREALEKHFGPTLGGAVYSESAKPKVELTKVALRDALRKVVLPTLPKEKAKITALERETLEVLRTRGAVSVATFTHVKEHKGELPAKPPPAEPPAAALEPPKPPPEQWKALSPEGRIDYGRTGDMAAAVAAEAKRRAERDARIAACAGVHQWGRMGECLRCGVKKPPMDEHVDVSSGHPVRMGVKLCSCAREAKPCVDAQQAAAGGAP